MRTKRKKQRMKTPAARRGARRGSEAGGRGGEARTGEEGSQDEETL
jgi:hypothetical protein